MGVAPGGRRASGRWRRIFPAAAPDHMPVAASRDRQGHEERHDVERDEMATTFPLLGNVGHDAAGRAHQLLRHNDDGGGDGERSIVVIVIGNGGVGGGGGERYSQVS